MALFRWRAISTKAVWLLALGLFATYFAITLVAGHFKLLDNAAVITAGFFAVFLGMMALAAMKSGVVRAGLKEVGEIAESGPVLLLDWAVGKGLVDEFSSMRSGKCQ